MNKILSAIGDLRIWGCNFIIGYIPFHFIRLNYYKYIMGFKIGKGSSIHLGTKFNSTKNLTIGNNCTVNQYCRLDNRGGIFIKDNVSISPYVKIITADHDIHSSAFIGRNSPVIINDFVFIGSDSMILPGVKLYEGVVIGAKSLVSKDTEPYGIYYGVPAKLNGYRNKELNYNTAYKRWFH